MENSWENEDRVNAVMVAVGNLPHDQSPIGIGFKLRHDPTSCRRCKANIAILELAAIIRMLENGESGFVELEATVNDT